MSGSYMYVCLYLIATLVACHAETPDEWSMAASSAEAPNLFDAATSLGVDTLWAAGPHLPGGDYQFVRITDADMDATGRVYVADLRAPSVILFGETGELIGQIGRKGSARGEYLAPFHVVALEDGVAVYDLTLNRITLYDTTGAAKKSFSTHGAPASDMVAGADGQLLLAMPGPSPHVRAYNLDGEVVATALDAPRGEREHRSRQMPMSGRMCQAGEQLRYSSPFMYEITTLHRSLRASDVTSERYVYPRGVRPLPRVTREGIHPPVLLLAIACTATFTASTYLVQDAGQAFVDFVGPEGAPLARIETTGSSPLPHGYLADARGDTLVVVTNADARPRLYVLRVRLPQRGRGGET